MKTKQNKNSFTTKQKLIYHRYSNYNKMEQANTKYQKPEWNASHWTYYGKKPP